MICSSQHNPTWLDKPYPLLTMYRFIHDALPAFIGFFRKVVSQKM